VSHDQTHVFERPDARPVASHELHRELGERAEKE
jgi:hypothetical protein